MTTIIYSDASVSTFHKKTLQNRGSSSSLDINGQSLPIAGANRWLSIQSSKTTQVYIPICSGTVIITTQDSPVGHGSAYPQQAWSTVKLTGSQATEPVIAYDADAHLGMGAFRIGP